jgi:hypothetical protein
VELFFYSPTALGYRNNVISPVPYSIVFLEKLIVASGGQEMFQLYGNCYSEATERSSHGWWR